MEKVEFKSEKKTCTYCNGKKYYLQAGLNSITRRTCAYCHGRGYYLSVTQVKVEESDDGKASS